MSLSLLQLDGCWLLALRIDARQGNLPEAPAAGAPSVRYATHPQGDRQTVVKADFAIEWAPDEPSRFDKIEASLIGAFSVHENVSDDAVATYIPTLCLANMYGIARGIVAQATGMCPGGPYFMPMLNMNEVVKKAAPDKPVGGEPADDQPTGGATRRTRARRKTVAPSEGSN